MLCVQDLNHYLFSRGLGFILIKIISNAVRESMSVCLLLFLYINANPNLYFGSNPRFFCLIPFVYCRKSKSVLWLKPMISLSNSVIYFQANSNLYFGSNPSFFFLIPLYTFNKIQICTSANHMIFLLTPFTYIGKPKPVLKL